MVKTPVCGQSPNALPCYIFRRELQRYPMLKTEQLSSPIRISQHLLLPGKLQIHFVAFQGCLHPPHLKLSIPNAAVEVPNQLLLVGNFIL